MGNESPERPLTAYRWRDLIRIVDCVESDLHWIGWRRSVRMMCIVAAMVDDFVNDQ